MSEVPDNYHYTREHEWLKLEDDGTITVGITDHAQEALGELVFVETPEVGIQFAAGDVIETVDGHSVGGLDTSRYWSLTRAANSCGLPNRFGNGNDAARLS